jgi:ribosomal protein L37AE/L43A
MNPPDASYLALADFEEFDPRAPQGSMERRFLCPLCGEGKPKDAAHRSVSLNVKSGVWVCHRCGGKGKLLEWKQEKPQNRRELKRNKLRQAFALDSRVSEFEVSARADTLGKIEIRDRISEFKVSESKLSAHTDSSHTSLPHSGNSQLDISQRTSSEWRAVLKNMQPLAHTAGKKYLQDRGITVEVAHEAGVQFSPSWFGRPAVVFPIRDVQSTLVAVQGRYVRDTSGPKARTAGHKREGVFVTANFWRDLGRGAPLVICEAPIDALSIAVCGFPALALCGKDGWPQWLPIKCAFQTVALALDADEAGDIGADKLSKVLGSLGAKPFRMRPEKGKDWNELLIHCGRGELSDWLAQKLLW